MREFDPHAAPDDPRAVIHAVDEPCAGGWIPEGEPEDDESPVTDVDEVADDDDSAG